MTSLLCQSYRPEVTIPVSGGLLEATTAFRDEDFIKIIEQHM
jgi:hypothetical protein